MASSPKDPKQQKTKPIRRNDVIHCENCGEDYSVTYNRCPFCDERPAKNGRPRTAGGRRVAGGGRSGRPANPLQVAALVGSLVHHRGHVYCLHLPGSPVQQGRG